MKNSKNIDDDNTFEFPICNPYLKLKPTSYAKALEGFLDTPYSWHVLGNRVRWLHGKAAYLHYMMEFNAKKTREAMVKLIVPNFESYDQLTQFNVILLISDLGLSQLWSFVAGVYRSTKSWRLQSCSLWTMVELAKKNQLSTQLRSEIDDVLENSVTLKRKIMGEPSLAHYLQFSTGEDLSEVLVVCKREQAFLSEDCVKLFRNLVFNASTSSLLEGLNNAFAPSLVGAILEALYSRSRTHDTFPAFSTQLLQDIEPLSGFKPSTNTPIKDLFIYLIAHNSSKQRRGYALENILVKLFQDLECAIVAPFRCRGEQVDGLVEYQHLQYLIEAKWVKKPVSASTIYSFRGKVEGKLAGTRGLFVSANGFSREGVAALQSGKPLNIILVDGNDIYESLSIKNGLKLVLDRKIQEASRSGNVYATGNLKELLRKEAAKTPSWVEST